MVEWKKTPTSVPLSLVQKLRHALHADVREFKPVSGGCIANAGRLETSIGSFFLKWSDGEAGRTFAAEARGLQALKAAVSGDLDVPKVAAVGRADHSKVRFLALEWVQEGRRGKDFWQTLGRGLASMHRHTGDGFGFEEDNFIGRLPQRNTRREMWPAFFREERLEPQVARAREGRRWRAGWDVLLDALYGRLDDLLPERPDASILHGDLWSGNFLATAWGSPVIIDPAVYYGHREADLAMTKLFGGFTREFYEAYAEEWSLDGSYEERREIYNLYHLINHLNHFGGSYAGQVEGILRRFG